MTRWEDVAVDARGNMVDVTQLKPPGPPPDLTWSSLELIALGEPVLGKIVAVSNHRGIEYNLVAASELFTDTAGTWVRVAAREDYMAWQETARDRPVGPRRGRAVAANTVWVAHDKIPDRPGDGMQV